MRCSFCKNFLKVDDYWGPDYLCPACQKYFKKLKEDKPDGL